MLFAPKEGKQVDPMERLMAQYLELSSGKLLDFLKIMTVTQTGPTLLGMMISWKEN